MEENVGQESEFPAIPEGAPEVVCCYDYKNQSCLNRLSKVRRVEIWAAATFLPISPSLSLWRFCVSASFFCCYWPILSSFFNPNPTGSQSDRLS